MDNQQDTRKVFIDTKDLQRLYVKLPIIIKDEYIIQPILKNIDYNHYKLLN